MAWETDYSQYGRIRIENGSTIKVHKNEEEFVQIDTTDTVHSVRWWDNTLCIHLTTGMMLKYNSPTSYTYQSICLVGDFDKTLLFGNIHFTGPILIWSLSGVGTLEFRNCTFSEQAQLSNVDIPKIGFKYCHFKNGIVITNCLAEIEFLDNSMV